MYTDKKNGQNMHSYRKLLKKDLCTLGDNLDFLKFVWKTL